MDYTNLQILAEVSVTLLGFSGLTAVIGHSRFDQRGVAYRTLLLLYCSSLAFVGSILPLVGVPIWLAAISLAASMTLITVWVGRKMLGPSEIKVQTSLVLNLIFYPLGVMVLLFLWWSIISSAEQLLFIYQLSIGFNLVLGAAAFVRLVRSAFVTEVRSGND